MAMLAKAKCDTIKIDPVRRGGDSRSSFFRPFARYVRWSAQAAGFLTSLTISDIEPTLAERLRLRAAEHGLSVEAEAYSILKGALDNETTGTAGADAPDLSSRIHARFASLGGEEIVLPSREASREPPRFD